jgi:hypothetical protein
MPRAWMRSATRPINPDGMVARGLAEANAKRHAQIRDTLPLPRMTLSPACTPRKPPWSIYGQAANKAVSTD